MMKATLLVIASCSYLLSRTFVEGHGYLKSPRSRNWYSNPNSGSHEYGNPKEWDYCPHCLNLKEADSVCATGAQDYDNWVDNNGNPFPWTTQAIFTEGQEIEIEVVLSANHAGHIDMFICPDGENSTIECLLSNPLTFVRNVYDPEGPFDEFYPSRAYVSGAVDHKFIYKLPMGVYGDKVMMQWRYVTANSCIPPGYRRPELNLGADGLNWMRSPGMSDCDWPPNQTGARDTTNPEQFWNCADLKIVPASPTKSPAPTVEPAPTPAVTRSPTKAPVPAPPTSPTPVNGGCCTWDGGLTCPSDWCNENKSQCEVTCAGTFVGGNPPTAPTPTVPTPPTSPTPVTNVATTTRYWDCSGGACGCAYLPFGPGTDSEPAHCYSNAMFEAPTNNPYGAKFYGTAAISQALGGGNWMAEGCGKCWKVNGWSNIAGVDSFQTTLVLKGTNYCPPDNPACSGDKPHFDISAPGFDVTQFSLSNSCATREADEIDGFTACGRWMIDTQDPNVGCDCSLFKDPILRAGCQNFYSLLWDNSPVTYEEVDCPEELSRLNCWEENGQKYPDDIPQFCASNVDTPFTPPPTPTTTFGSESPSSLRGTSSPTKSKATTSPTKSPVQSPPSGGCCSWNIPNCGTGEWCNATKDRCESSCSGTWIDPNAPTTPPPVPSPTSSGDHCCSGDYKTCKTGWCNENEANCSSCGAKWIVLDTDCSLPLWGDCLSQPDACCAPATCHNYGSWAQCKDP